MPVKVFSCPIERQRKREREFHSSRRFQLAVGKKTRREFLSNLRFPFFVFVRSILPVQKNSLRKFHPPSYSSNRKKRKEKNRIKKKKIKMKKERKEKKKTLNDSPRKSKDLNATFFRFHGSFSIYPPVVPAAFEIRKTVTRNALAGQRDSTKRVLDLARPRPGNPRIPFAFDREGGGRYHSR